MDGISTLKRSWEIDNAEDLDTAAQIADDFDKIQYASPEIKEIAAIAHAKAKELSGSEEV